jgi:adenylate cyclase class 2
VRHRLRELGFVPVHRRSLEDNVLFDTPDRSLRKMRAILRIRHYGDGWRVTYKGTPETDRLYKSRVELESAVDDPRMLEELFQALGLSPVFRYQKYRTQFAPAKEKSRSRFSVEVALDETPIGNFIELEGSPRSIDRAATELGYSRGDYSTASYGSLYNQDCIRKGVPPTDMTFAAARRVKRQVTSRQSAERKERPRR